MLTSRCLLTGTYYKQAMQQHCTSAHWCLEDTAHNTIACSSFDVPPHTQYLSTDGVNVNNVKPRMALLFLVLTKRLTDAQPQVELVVFIAFRLGM